MTEQRREPVTIIKQGNTIIIAQPPAKQENNFLDVFSGLFNKDPISTEIQKQGVIAFGDDTYVPSAQGENCTWTNLFSCENMTEAKLFWKCKVSQWKDADIKLANNITKFKQQNLMTLGDIRIRSILMAFSSAVLYKVISLNTTGFLRKTRNLGLSFAFMGYWFVPELFNPFLRKPVTLRNII